MRANYFDSGRQVFSYQTVILERHNGLTIGNVTLYGIATARHQVRAGSMVADVRLDNVPKGATDLLTIAVNCGLVGMAGGAEWSVLHARATHADAS